jgi:formate hydrogenlyase subunit 6/NADH:ubiquinone oxidoreductase subunit I
VENNRAVIPCNVPKEIVDAEAVEYAKEFLTPVRKPSSGVGIAGYRGRHILFHDKCTGCQLCAIACEGIAEAIGMVKVEDEQQWKQNKKGIMPQIDYGKCVFLFLPRGYHL